MPRARTGGGPPQRRSGRAENIDAVQKAIRKRASRGIETRLGGEVALGPLHHLTVQAWIENRDFLHALSDEKRVRHALKAPRSRSVPMAAPSVAPWTPPAERRGKQKPN